MGAGSGGDRPAEISDEHVERSSVETLGIEVQRDCRQIGNALQIDRVGEPRAQERRGSDQRAFEWRFRRVVDACVTNIDGQDDRVDAHIAQRGIGDLVAHDRAELFEDETLHSRVPMTGRALFFSLHEKRLQE